MQKTIWEKRGGKEGRSTLPQLKKERDLSQEARGGPFFLTVKSPSIKGGEKGEGNSPQVHTEKRA